MRNGEPQIYASLTTMRNGYMTTQWQRVQMFLLFNTVAVPLMYAGSTSAEVKLLVSVAALLVHWVIFHGTLRADAWIKFIDGRLVKLEGLDKDDDEGIRVRVFSHPSFEDRRNTWFASRRFFGAVGVLALTFWVSQFVNQLHPTSH